MFRQERITRQEGPKTFHNKKNSPWVSLPGLEDHRIPQFHVVHITEGKVRIGGGGGDYSQEWPGQAVQVAGPGVHGVPPVVDHTFQQVLEVPGDWY